MKKTSLILLMVALFSISAQAQFTKVGAGLVYGSGFGFNGHEEDSHRIGNPALKFQAIYEVNLPVHFSPGLTLFMPRVTKEFEYKYVTSAFLLDLDAHYVFNSLDRFEIYGLGGLNITYTRLKFDSEFFDAEVNSDNKLGLNLGIGSYMKFSEQLDFYGEIKYILSGYDQLVITAGVLLNLQWLKENEEPVF